jgi:hypothetical protein
LHGLKLNKRFDIDKLGLPAGSKVLHIGSFETLYPVSMADSASGASSNGGDHITKKDAIMKADETKDTAFPSTSEDHFLEELSPFAEAPVSQIVKNIGDNLPEEARNFKERL